jgi:hypothetical protein
MKDSPEEAARKEECTAELKAILDKYGYRIHQRMVPTMELISMPKSTQAAEPPAEEVADNAA